MPAFKAESHSFSVREVLGRELMVVRPISSECEEKSAPGENKATLQRHEGKGPVGGDA